MSGIELPEIPESAGVDLTTAQLRQVYDRIELIDQHFEKCCAFQMDRCHYGDEYNRMYQFLYLAGLERWRGPFGRDEFETWISEREGAEA